MKKSILFLVLTLQLYSQNTFRFAHISDTHIGSATAAEDLRRTVNDINTIGNISFAILTGDITEFGSDEQFRLAKQILDSLNIPWHIVPGNHDMKWSESGGTSFAKIFGSERFAFDHSGYKFIGVHQGPRMRMGDAYWTHDDVAWLDSILSSMKNSRMPYFIATHYPADSGIANWYVLTDAAKKYNLQAFLNGHWHRNHFGIFDEVPSIVGRSNLRARDSIGGYNIVEIRNDSMIYSTRIPGVQTKQPWKIIQLDDRKYSTSERSVELPKSSGVDVLWKKTSQSPMNCPPVTTKNYRAFAYHDGNVVLYDTKGKLVATIETGSSIMATPAIYETKIVIPSTDSLLYCFDIRSQKLLWKVKTGASLVAPPIIDNNNVYLGGSDKKFRAINLTSGKILWSFDSLQGHVEAKPLLIDGKIIFGAWDEHLYCLDQKTGKLLWKWKSDRPGTLLSPAVCEPVSAHGKVFIVAPDRFMTAIDINTGKQLWRTNQFQVRETMGISEDGERVYVRTMNDSLYALSTKKDFPEVIWSLNAAFGYEINSSQIKEKDGVIFHATKNGLLIAIEGKTGKLLWTFKEDVVIAHTPIPIAKNRVIFSNILGTVCEVVLK